jgi:hypothetical protein
MIRRAFFSGMFGSSSGFGALGRPALRFARLEGPGAAPAGAPSSSPGDIGRKGTLGKPAPLPPAAAAAAAEEEAAGAWPPIIPH